MQEPSPSAELQAAGWSAQDVRRYRQLWSYRSRWGAANLDRDERRFLRRGDDALRTIQRSPAPDPPAGLADRQPDCFVALDFETADQGRDSACSIALVRVEWRRIVRREHHLIRPPRRTFLFTSIHGISWARVADAPTFAELWPQLAACLEGAQFIAAHNASFDAGVLRACCEQAGLRPPAQPFVCTVQVARRAWNLRPTRLPDVCRHLGLPLRHHDALSDAEACAGIVLAAGQELTAGLARSR
ncbi:DNA polymerase III subunit epsilon-like 3'-5' exonuclease [Cyanobium sp. Copco_Reservoir_LC18]|uniref:3'-5' exonuclease n=1 Tax=Cyanobium sp. Copco_Reservoir_LC18 TaxID=1328305 RepID=UPI0013569037|nr:3'-5' exonuclease [Cyanobium sp. Copco_Reservoir_LC18]KAF0652932.1 DNA polymerase III subunit epsilon-like 3'-5' exonuclease [Cyanobium sp. Copco_Reservoir_LC18]